jgi:hypothetical protein
MDHIGKWHNFNPADRRTYPKVDAPVQVKYADGIFTEGTAFAPFLQESVFYEVFITNWRYVRDKASSKQQRKTTHKTMHKNDS